jgi:hypothetical protein
MAEADAAVKEMRAKVRSARAPARSCQKNRAHVDALLQEWANEFDVKQKIRAESAAKQKQIMDDAFAKAEVGAVLWPADVAAELIAVLAAT